MEKKKYAQVLIFLNFYFSIFILIKIHYALSPHFLK